MVAEKRSIGLHGNCILFLARSKREDGHTAHPAQMARSVAPGLVPPLCRAYPATVDEEGRPSMTSGPGPSHARSERRRRNRVLTMRVDSAELVAIQRAAYANGMSVSSYIRDAAVRRANKPKTTLYQARLISQLAGVVGLLKPLRSGLKDRQEHDVIGEAIRALAAVSDSFSRNGS